MRLDEFDLHELSWSVIVESGTTAVHNKKPGVRINDTFFYVEDGAAKFSSVHETVYEEKRFVDNIPKEAFIPRGVKHQFRKLMTGGKEVKAAIKMYRELLAKEKAGQRKGPHKSPLHTAASMFGLDVRELESEIRKSGQ